MPIYEYDCEACGTRFEELVFLELTPEERHLPGVQQRAGRQAVIVDRRVREREHGRRICVCGVHDQRLRGEPLDGREPATDDRARAMPWPVNSLCGCPVATASENSAVG